MTHAVPSLSRRLALLGTLLFVASCGGSDTPTDTGPDDPTPTPTVGAVAILSAPAAQVVGSTVSVDVRVDDTSGQAISGTAVTFSVTAGSVTPSSTTTNAIGVAQVAWTLGTAPGSQTLTATASGRSATVSVQTESGPPAAFAMVSGDAQTGPVGEALAAPLVVSVKDAFGNPKAGETVAFAVTGGGGSVPGSSASTGSDGQASITWTLGTALGENTLTASHPLGTVTFTATAEAGAPATLEKVDGDDQTAVAGTAVSTPPSVRVTDAGGNPVGGATVTFAVISGGGSVTGESATTGSDGIATVGGWTLGTTVGANSLSATATGLPTVTFVATGQAGPAAVLQKAAGDEQSAGVGATLATAPRIRAVDANGNAVGGVSVTFAVASGGGTVTGASATTAADGLAAVGSWTLGPVPGAQSLSATAVGLPAVTFTATAEAGAPAAALKVAGDAQVAVVGTAVATPPSVRVTDGFGNPLGGVAVVFAVTGGGGSITGAGSTTDADGTAAVGSWTLGPAVGVNSLSATVAGLAPVTFTATAQAGAPTSLAKTAGDAQSAQAGTSVAIPPTVTVTDALGNPVGGVEVTFAVTSGGGSLTGATTTTGTDGTASVGSWILGATAGANTLSAIVSGLAPVTFTATGTSAGASTYNIDLRFIGTVPSGIQAAFEQAKARWEQVIVGDLSNGQLTSAAGECFEAQPAVNEVVDDIIIFAEVAAIDGVGNTLGQAGPCYTRSSNGLTMMGAMTFDEADLADMETEGTLQDVILHEMGHVLGIGTLWENNSLLQGAGTDDPFFSGTNAVAAYTGLGGVLVNGVPVENTGEEGTRDGHWRESIFDNELMTGYIAAANNPMSVITVRSLADQGYTVNEAAADTYAIPSPAPVGADLAPTRLIGRWEVLIRPIGSVTPEGRIRPIR